MLSNAMNYCDQLRETMKACGLSVSPVITRNSDAALRFDSINVTDNTVTFYWLGKPVHMARRQQDHLVHMNGEMSLNLH